MKADRKLDLSLYLVLDANLCKTPEGMVETTRKAVEGGCTVVQLRAPEWKKKKQLEAAFLLKKLLKDTDVLFIVDDHIDIALLSGADVRRPSARFLPTWFRKAYRVVTASSSVQSVTQPPDLIFPESFSPNAQRFRRVRAKCLF